MTASIPAPTLRPGDPPPFWDGLWHPEGKTEGAIMVKPLMAGQTPSTPAMAAPAAPAAAPSAPPAAVHEVRAAIAEQAIPMAPPAPPVAQPVAAAAASDRESGTGGEPIQMGAPTQPQTPPQQPQQPAAPRSFVGSLVAQGGIQPTTSVPSAIDAEGAAALRQKAKELQAAGQLGPALQALNEALKRAPGDAATYAQIGSLLLAGKAWEDAAHHFLLAYMLAPKEASYGRMTLHAAFVLGYVGWAFQLAQALFRIQQTPDLAEIGRAAQGWLSQRGPAYTALCPTCRTNSIVGQPGPCAKCGGATLGAPANATGFVGMRLMQQSQGRLLAGATCVSCSQDTVLVVAKGGPCCQHCQQPALANL